MRKTLETLLSEAVKQGGKKADERIRDKLGELEDRAKNDRTRYFWREVRKALYGAPTDEEE